MGKTLRYGEFVFPKGDRVQVKSHSRVRTARKPDTFADGGPIYVKPGDPMPTLDPVNLPTGDMASDPNKVFGALNQMKPADTGSGALAGGTGRPVQAVHNINEESGGFAPLTASNVGKALQNAAALTSGLGALTTGLKSIAEMVAGQDPGSFNGLQTMQGRQAYDSIARQELAAGMTPSTVQARQQVREQASTQAAYNAGGSHMGSGGENIGSGATESHGQVRGGGTGSEGGGLTQGGPRKRGGRIRARRF